MWNMGTLNDPCRELDIGPLDHGQNLTGFACNWWITGYCCLILVGKIFGKSMEQPWKFTDISDVSVENPWKLNGELENNWNIIRTSIEHQLPSASPISVSRLDRFGWFSQIFHRTWMEHPHFKSHPTQDVQAAEKLLRPGEHWRWMVNLAECGNIPGRRWKSWPNSNANPGDCLWIAWINCSYILAEQNIKI